MKLDNQQTSKEDRISSNIVIHTYYNQIYCKNYKNYSRYRVKLILKKLGSKAKLPRDNREIEVIKTNKVIVYLARDKDNYYFRERLLPKIHKPVDRVIVEPKKSLESSIKNYLGLN